MSMDQKAIQEIIKHANTKDVIEALKAAGTKSNLMALPNDFSIQDLEHYMPQRDRFRAVMNTEVIDEFVSYTVKHADKEQSQCFVNVNRMSAKTTFDIGTLETPLHADHKAILTLKKTALFNALLGIDGVKMQQKDAAEWVEDFAEHLTAFDSEGVIMGISAVSTAMRNITVKAESGRTSVDDDFAAQQSAYENVAIQTKDNMKMPAVIKFACEPYNGLGMRGFELRHSVITGGQKPMIVLRIKMLEKHQEDMAKEFKEVLQAELKDKLPIYLGTLEL